MRCMAGEPGVRVRAGSTPVMRVLMTADAVGGVWRYAVDLAAALVPHRVEVTLAVTGPPPSEAREREARSVPHLRLHVAPFRLEWMPDPWDDLARAGEWLGDLARSVRPHVVHLNGYTHAARGWDCPVLCVAHSCVLSWWAAVHGEPAPPDWDRYRAAVLAGLRAADLVVAPSAAMLDALQAQYGPVRRACVIHNGRSAHGLRPAIKEPFVLTAGRLWDPAKNVAVLTAIAPDLPWPVYVAGPTAASPIPGRASGTTAPEAGGAPGDGGPARVLGVLDAHGLAAWMNRASIYVLPARYEPFGLSVVEAALAGCALVLGDIPSLRELWSGCAVFVRPDDHDALRRAIRGLIANETHCRALGRAARIHAARYDLARAATAYRAVYGRLGRARGTDAPRPVAPSREDMACTS